MSAPTLQVSPNHCSAVVTGGRVAENARIGTRDTPATVNSVTAAVRYVRSSRRVRYLCHVVQRVFDISRCALPVRR